LFLNRSPARPLATRFEAFKTCLISHPSGHSTFIANLIHCIYT
jgi:hypothetical protein